jgi:tetratricopeptide (TPR) repeat protein
MQTKLEEYPGLLNWFVCNRSEPESIAERFVWRTCKLMTGAQQNLLPECWSRIFLEELQNSTDPVGNFLEIQRHFNECEADFLDFVSDLGQTVIQTPSSGPFQSDLERAADLTNLASLRFLSAWICMNEGALSKCIHECDKVEEFYSPIYTIKGQALLETGDVKGAIEALNETVRASPQELLAWFQLAKAYHVTKKFQACWGSLIQCRRLAPQSAEVAVFMGMAAYDSECMKKSEVALKALEPFWEDYSGNAQFVFTLLKLALKLDHEALAEKIVHGSNWEHVRRDPQFYREIPAVLKLLQKNNRMPLAAILLEFVTEEY